MQNKAINLGIEIDICKMNQTYCVALVFSRKSFRYRAYARKYTEALLSMQKHVVIVSPDCLELQQDLLVKFKSFAEKLSFVPITENDFQQDFPNHLELMKRLYRLTRYLNAVEISIQTKVDLVFFAPFEDWIKPKFRKWIFKKIFPFAFTGLITRTRFYSDGSLKLNVDPKHKEFDYLLSTDTCVGVCTLDRFITEKIRSRIYRKVILMPDVSEFELQDGIFEFGHQIRKMAKGRMLIGALFIDNEFPIELLDLIKTATDDLYFFLLIGEISSILLTEAQKENLNELLQSGKSNYYIKTDFDASKEKVNSLIKSLDVIYIGCNKEELPSIMFTKAAKFEKPIISFNHEYTSKLVVSFKLGLVINADYYNQIDVLQTLRLQLPFNLNYDFKPLKTYAKLQSQEYLKQAWEELLWF